MTQDNNSINSHIETYLDYYFSLPHAPGFAVLLKGKWGSGKTWFIKWFINEYCEKYKDNKPKCLYISLYGMTAFSEIEDAFFQQLHPVLSSKKMAFTGRVLRGLLKVTLKIDLNNDSRDDGTLSSQIPDINLPDYLKNTDKSILVFDDLERCNIELSNILGYINYFVEHQGLKVVIIANEEELIQEEIEANRKDNNSYKVIKEKLIGKTFDVSPDFEGALKDFIDNTNNSSLKQFLFEKTELIKDLYEIAEYNNLRTLKQVILDFGRIFEALSEEAKNNLRLLQNLLKLLMVFSIEIKQGNILPEDIVKLQSCDNNNLAKILSLRAASQVSGESSTVKEDDSEEKLLKLLNAIKDKYNMLNLKDPFPSSSWWETFFHKGIVDEDELKNQYNLLYKTPPNWVQLGHYYYRYYFDCPADEEFENLLNNVESEYRARKFLDLRVIEQIFELLLVFSEAELYPKNKADIIKDSKDYIDYLKNNHPDVLLSSANITIEQYLNDIVSRKSQEFTDFREYIQQKQEEARLDNMPTAGEKLLDVMQSDVRKFCSMICRNHSQNENLLDYKYYEIPIFKYIKLNDFVEKFLQIHFQNQCSILSSLKERYSPNNFHDSFHEELAWIQSVRELLLKEANSKKGKLSGYVLKSGIIPYLDEALKELESQRKIE